MRNEIGDCTMVKEHKYTMLWDKKEKDRITKWGKEQGYSGLAKLIEASLDIVQRHPELLQPQEKYEPHESEKILETLKQAKIEASQELLETLTDHSNRLDRMEKLIEGIALKVGMSKKELKEAQKKDLSSEAIFE